jgi:hypothetical protein
MTSLNYTSVATVALHINSLIKRGHLQKRGRSARSLELTAVDVEQAKLTSNEVKPGEEKWLVQKIEHHFRQAESQAQVTEQTLDMLYVLIGALKVLGIEGAAQSFIPRLSTLKQKVVKK